MRRVLSALAILAIFAVPAFGADTPADSSTTVRISPPPFPSPMQMSILGLSITAIAVVGARVSNRNSDTMMYMVLASVAVTALMVVFSDKQYRAYDHEMRELLRQLQHEPAAAAAADKPS